MNDNYSRNDNWNLSQTRNSNTQPNVNSRFPIRQNVSNNDSNANTQIFPRSHTEFSSQFIRPPMQQESNSMANQNLINNSPQRFPQGSSEFNSPLFLRPPSHPGEIRQPNNFQTQVPLYNTSQSVPSPQDNFPRPNVRFTNLNSQANRPPQANVIGPILPNTSTQSVFTPLHSNLSSIPTTVQSGFKPLQETFNSLPPLNSTAVSSIPFNNTTYPIYSSAPSNVPFQTISSNFSGNNMQGPMLAAEQIMRPQNFINLPSPSGITTRPPSFYNSQLLSHPPPNVSSNDGFVVPPVNVNIPPPVNSIQTIVSSGNVSIFPPVPSQNETPLQRQAISDKERKLHEFLEKFPYEKEDKSQPNLIVKEYQSSLSKGLSFIKELQLRKENLTLLLHSDEKEWEIEVKKVLQLRSELQKICNFLTLPKNLDSVEKKLKFIKKKRNIKKKLRQKVQKEKAEKLKKRDELHREIDKWLDSVKEKNLKLKREAEMKKEADSILSEVRRKIQEAKRAIEKLKVFEKLRNARQANAMKKGLLLPEHDQRFQESFLHLREIMLRQLSHYEDEEKALKVMLEAEQEGQLEEEAKWKVKKLRTIQERKQKNIVECLFGDSVEDPDEEDPMYLFFQFHNSANKSVENLVQIRNQWDMYINENGESIPHQWVVPSLPTHSSWEVYVEK